jgi:hypothetical protein
MGTPTIREISMTCPVKGCDASQMVSVPIASKLSDLGTQTCPRGHRFRFTPAGQAVAIDEEGDTSGGH